MEIRAALETDRDYLAEVCNAVLSYHHSLDTFYRPLTNAEEMQEFLTKQDISLVATDENGAYIGAVVGQYVAEPADRTVSYAALRSLWVEPATRGKGIAGSLVRAFEAEAHERGAQFVDMHVDTHNELALALWNGLGYETYQERRRKPLQ